MKEKLYRFMQGRYGVDALSKFMMAAAVVSMVLMWITRRQIFDWITILLIVLVYFRMLSRNIPARYAENQKFLKMTGGIRNWWYRLKRDFAQRKTHHIYHCPNCRQKVRVPKGRGRIAIRCPKCGTEFIKNS